MKFIYITHWRFPSEKVTSQSVMRICEEFSRQGVETELWVPRRANRKFKDQDPFAFFKTERNFVIRRLPVVDLMELAPVSASFILMVATFAVSVAAYAVVRRLARARDVVFNVHDARDAILLTLVAPNVVLEIHDFYKSSVEWVNRWVFGRMRGFIVTNSIKIKAIRGDYGIPEDRMLRELNAADPALFDIATPRPAARRALGLPQDKKIILYTGHLYAWKGVDTLLEAARLDAARDNGLLFIFLGGTDSDIAAFRKKAEGCANVLVAGRKPHYDVPLWCAAADVFIVPNTAKDPASKYETSPIKLFEYMAARRPIVASDLPSIREIVDETRAFFFEPDNPADLVRTIGRVLENPAAAEQRALAARSFIAEHTWEERTRRIINFFKTRVVSGV